jgi:hypothetical protein
MISETLSIVLSILGISVIPDRTAQTVMRDRSRSVPIEQSVRERGIGDDLGLFGVKGRFVEGTDRRERVSLGDHSSYPLWVLTAPVHTLTPPGNHRRGRRLRAVRARRGLLLQRRRSTLAASNVASWIEPVFDLIVQAVLRLSRNLEQSWNGEPLELMAALTAFEVERILLAESRNGHPPRR